MSRGRQSNERLARTSITLPDSTMRRLTELQLLLRISRSEVIAYIIDREYERRQIELNRLRALRNRAFPLEEVSHE